MCRLLIPVVNEDSLRSEDLLVVLEVAGDAGDLLAALLERHVDVAQVQLGLCRKKFSPVHYF